MRAGLNGKSHRQPDIAPVIWSSAKCATLRTLSPAHLSGAATVRGPEFTAEERAARQICKLLAEGPLARERLTSEWLAIRREMSGPSRPALGGKVWERDLAAAVAQGWLGQKEGMFSTTKAGS